MRLSTDKKRERCPECKFSREEVYDKESQRYIASIAYNPFECLIERLSVDKDFQRQGIGSNLAKRAIEDMRVNYGCKEISLWSTPSAEGFWKKTGSISEYHSSICFSCPLVKLILNSNFVVSFCQRLFIKE